MKGYQLTLAVAAALTSPVHSRYPQQVVVIGNPVVRVRPTTMSPIRIAPAVYRPVGLHTTAWPVYASPTYTPPSQTQFYPNPTFNPNPYPWATQQQQQQPHPTIHYPVYPATPPPTSTPSPYTPPPNYNQNNPPPQYPTYPHYNTPPANYQPNTPPPNYQPNTPPPYYAPYYSTGYPIYYPPPTPIPVYNYYQINPNVYQPYISHYIAPYQFPQPLPVYANPHPYATPAPADDKSRQSSAIVGALVGFGSGYVAGAHLADKLRYDPLDPRSYRAYSFSQYNDTARKEVLVTNDDDAVAFDDDSLANEQYYTLMRDSPNSTSAQRTAHNVTVTNNIWRTSEQHLSAATWMTTPSSSAQAAHTTRAIPVNVGHAVPATYNRTRIAITPS